jgi:hypothetical protein
MVSNPGKKRYRFRDMNWDSSPVFSLGPCDLKRNGEPVGIDPMPLRILYYLVEKAPEPVMKEEFVGWLRTKDPTANNVDVHLTAIRAALGENAANPAYFKPYKNGEIVFFCPVEHEPEEGQLPPTKGVLAIEPRNPESTSEPSLPEDVTAAVGQAKAELAAAKTTPIPPATVLSGRAPRSHRWLASLLGRLGEVRSGYPRLLLFVAVAAFSASLLFLYLILGRAETPNEVLKIGLAVFSPKNPETDSLRLDLQRSLQENIFGGPPIRVELLDGLLDAAPEDLDKQATDLSHGHVNLVIAAAVGADGRLVPRVGLVRPFGYRDLADFPDVLNGFAFRVPTGSTTETAPVSDLTKILYAFRYATPASWDKFEFILRDMEDQRMATGWLVSYLGEWSNRVSRQEGLANLQRAIGLVSAIRNPTPEVACQQDGSPGQFVNCFLLLNRAFSFSMIGRFVPPVEGARYADLGLADIETVEPQFKKLRAPNLMIAVAAYKADLYKNKASFLEGESARNALETSRLLFRDLITHLSAYPSVKNQRTLARVRYAFSGVLIGQSVIDTNRTDELAMDALEQLSDSLAGCPENALPSGIQSGMDGALQRIRRRLGLDSCLLDDYVWADAKSRALLVYAVLAGGTFDDGSIRGDAERSYQAATRVFSKDIDPLSWANNQLNLATVLLRGKTERGDQHRNSCDVDRRVVALL